MDGRFGSEAPSVYIMEGANVWAPGKRTVEWDLNDWRWDGDLFAASPIKPVPTRVLMKNFPMESGVVSLDGASSNSGCSSEEATAEIDGGKRDLEKRRRVLAEDDEEELGSLSLKLGGSSEERNGRLKTKASGGSSKAVCQVEGCGTDLSSAKDYHRRHKVCEAHSKATKALVGNVFQRFCQQCSRFHVLQEFDEGKRSCRRRLAGHNKRRRKIQPEAAPTPSSQNNEPTNNLLLINLLKLISTMNSDRRDQSTDQELLFHLLKSVANQGSETATRTRTTSRVLESPRDESKQTQQSTRHDERGSHVKMNSFDLNDIYIDSDNSTDEADGVRINFAQTSGNSESASAQSPSSSSGDGGRTDRIIFKLFGKEPNDIPLLVRTQILDWLSHTPTDIESYIRPGCVVLTVYLRQPASAWEDLRSDLSSSIKNLLESSDDSFWRLGWILVRVQDHAALAFNGEVIFVTRLANHGRILSVKPIATPSAKNVRFLVKCNGMSLSSANLLCSLEGNYVLEDDKDESGEGFFTYSCSLPSVTARGFIEVEDERLSGGFFPFIVADEEMCDEIRALEAAIDLGESEGRDRAIEFINELGWLLRRSQLRKRMKNTAPLCHRRFKWLVEYSIEREWCAVLKNLLDILLDGVESTTEFPDVVLALSELCLLHKAVKSNSRKLVEFLLSYVPKTRFQVPDLRPIFRPDATDAAGLTPLHIAAGKDESESVLDALTNDAQLIGVDAWEHAADGAGLTPEYYARLRGHISYIHLVKRKGGIREEKDYVALDVCSVEVDGNSARERSVARSDMGRQCKGCSERLTFRTGHGSLVYRPAMVCMIAIATVCVCAALYFKSCPEVEFVFRPFRWEMLDYGAI